MPITADDIAVLSVLARYYVLTREQVGKLLENPVSPRSLRKRLSKLRRAGFITKHRIPVVLPGANGAAPVYYPTKAGSELLASWFDNERYLTANTRSPRGDRLSHWIAINDTRITIDQAIARQTDVTLDAWINEWEVVDKDANEALQFTLHTQLKQNPPLSCSPDAAFLLCLRGHKKVFYVEQDLATSSPKQIAARKTKGYAELAALQLHRKHFPETTLPVFSVLVITTSAYRVKAIRKAVSKRPRPDLWLFVDQGDLRPESFLFEPVIQNSDGEAGPLVKIPQGQLKQESTAKTHDD